MRLRSSGSYLFDELPAVQNWYYPLATRPVHIHSRLQLAEAYATHERDVGKPIALYVHVPFCETICAFCPFVRTTRRENEWIDAYVEALLREIALKADMAAFATRPVQAIFFGGGTPSLLSPEQIRRLGLAIHERFVVAPDVEFSFEMEAKSVTDERLSALRDCGVTHVRLGAQTFDPVYREAFNLTATLDQVHDALARMLSHFKNVSFDILYGMNGQSLDAFLIDVEEALAIGAPLIDFYPINNTVTQRTLHARYARFGLAPAPATLKLEMTRQLRTRMARAGYQAHNGHGYVRSATIPLVEQPFTDAYSFRYHEFVYGYGGLDIVGFGTNAISTSRRYSIQNTASRADYIDHLATGVHPPASFGACDPMSAESKALIFRTPYHGVAEKAEIDFLGVYPETLERMVDLIEAGLLVETDTEFRLTPLAADWYVNLMYYMLPAQERALIDAQVEAVRSDRHKRLDDIERLLPAG